MDLAKIPQMKPKIINPFKLSNEENQKENSEINLINYSQSIEKSSCNNTNITRKIPAFKNILEFQKKKNILIINEKEENTQKQKNKSFSEMRLLKDLEEYRSNKTVGNICSIILQDYSLIEDSFSFQMIVDFIKFFSVKFIFTPDYPFSPPLIFFHRGNKSSHIFDEDGNIRLHKIEKINWTPSIWLSNIIHSIELLILDNLQNNNYREYNLFVDKSRKYCKRKWNDYLKDAKYYYHNNNNYNENNYNNYNNTNCSEGIINCLEKNIKVLKISN